jgi:hypothetical protein
MWPWSKFARLEAEIVRLKNDLRSAEMTYTGYMAQNMKLEDRVRALEADEREIRLNLLRRSGVLPSEAHIDAKEREFKPVKKTVIPWSQQAARLEADSKERYWKKQIELRERPQEARKGALNNPDEPVSAQADYDRDLMELEDVSSS